MLVRDENSGHIELTREEGEALAFVGEGLTNEAIADQLVLSLAAVESRIHRFAEKHDLRGRALVVFAVAHMDCCVLPVLEAG
jgi:DNA-binding NarL/FixJ family response regulator